MSEPRKCKQCGKSLLPRKPGAGRIRRFCDSKCRYTAWYQKHREEMRVDYRACHPLTERMCSRCGARFLPTHGRQTLCSACREAAMFLRPILARQCRQCGGAFVPERNNKAASCSPDCRHEYLLAYWRARSRARTAAKKKLAAEKDCP